MEDLKSKKIELENSILLIIVISVPLLLSIHLDFPLSKYVRVISGVIYMFLPGYLSINLIYPKKEKTMNFLERIVLSIVLSVAFIPLIIFYLNLVGFNINLLNSILAIFIIIMLLMIITLAKLLFNYPINT